jgi:hypothetical protein
MLALVAACGEREIGGVPAREWKATGPRAAEEAAAALADGDPWVRRWAVVGLSRPDVAAEVAVPALTRALDDECDAIREGAALGLARYRELAAEAVPALVAIVKDERGPVADTAAWALAWIGKPARAHIGPIRDRVSRSIDLALPRVAGARRQKFMHDDELVIVCMDCHGTISVRRLRMTPSRLRRYLLLRADSSRRSEPPMFSNVHVYLGLDEDLPWRAAEILLSVAGSYEVRMDRIELACETPPPDGHLATVSAPISLPLEAEEAVAVLRLGFGGPAANVAETEPRFRTLARRHPDAFVSVRVASWVPIREVLPVLVAIEKAGLRSRPEGFRVDESLLNGDVATMIEGARRREQPSVGLRWEVLR